MARICVFLVLFFLHFVGFGQSVLSLKEALNQALEYNLDVKITQKEVLLAKESNTLGNAGFLPSLSLTGGRNFQWNSIEQRFANGLVVERSGVATNQFNAGLGLNWVLYDGGQMFIVKKKQDAQQTASEFKLQNQILNLYDSVSGAYYQLVLAGEEIKLAKEEKKRTEERRKLAAEQVRLGLRSRSDLLMAEIDLNLLQNKINGLSKQQEIRKGNFNLLLGRSPEVEFETEDAEFPETKRMQFEELKTKVQAQNPFLKFQKQNLEISKLNLKQIKTRALPQISLNSAYNLGQTRNEAGFALFNRSFGPNIGLSLAMPLFQGVGIKKLTQLGNLDFEMKELQLKSIETRLQNQTWRTVKSLEIQLDNLESEKQNLEFASENLQIQKERFRLGQSTSLEIKEAEFQLSSCQFRLLLARYNARILKMQLQKLGGEISLPEGK